ncbi:hypothetical protein C0989_006721, partial [Termitomyces sp. Mn162]
MFAQAIISICGVASTFSGSGADFTQYLGTMQLHFANQANFLHIAKQKGLFDSLSNILPTLNCGTANISANMQFFLTFANVVTQIEKNHGELQCKCKAEE